MAQRSTKPVRRNGAAKGAGGGSRRSGGRGTAVKVSKPFPWGGVLTSVVLGALLIGLVVYAALNQGSGRRDLLKEADGAISGLSVAKSTDLTRNHVPGTVAYPGYPGTPPDGGDHNGVWQQCAVYTAPIPAENAVHSLEHGAVWVTYRPDLPADQVQILTKEVQGDPYRLLSPLPDQQSPVVLSAWGRQLATDSASDPRVASFLSTYTNGRQTPERGATCSGGSSQTGTTPAGAPAAPPAAARTPGGSRPSAPASPAPPVPTP